MSFSRNAANDNEEQERLAFLRGIGALPEENKQSATRDLPTLSPEMRQMLGLPPLAQNTAVRPASNPIKGPVLPNLFFSQKMPIYPPPIIDFIWLDGPIPEKYLRSILKLRQVLEIDAKDKTTNIHAPAINDLSITIWTNNKKNILSTLNKVFVDTDFSAQCQKEQIAGIHIKCIDEFFDELKNSNDPFWCELINVHMIDSTGRIFPMHKMPRATVFEMQVLRERTGKISRSVKGNNLAAASDLLRYALKYMRGGYYFDCDIDFCIKSIKKMTLDELPRGVKFLMEYKQEEGVLKTIICNDIICSVPLNKYIKDALRHAVDSYFENERLAIRKNKHFNFLYSVNDVKRSTTLFAHENKIQSRENLVINSTGPGAIRAALSSHLSEFYIDEIKNEFSLFCFKSKGINGDMCEVDIAGIKAFRKFTMSWMNSDTSIKSHDDSDLPSCVFFQPKYNKPFPSEVIFKVDTMSNKI